LIGVFFPSTEILGRLRNWRAVVQIDERSWPSISPRTVCGIPSCLQDLRAASPTLKLILATYFGELRSNLRSPQPSVDVLHIDVTRASAEFAKIVEQLPSSMSLSLGLVDGRNIWRNDFELSLDRIAQAKQVLGNERILLAPSCSLLHAPVTLRKEKALPEEIKDWLAFAEEKLGEVTQLARLADGRGDPAWAQKNRAAVMARRSS
jgi:5-methyltetrahydropteroyltriglutamate--homocysteine methyltransferase